MIDRGDIRQAIDRCSNIWASLRALVMIGSGAQAGCADFVEKRWRSGGMMAVKVLDYLSALVICIIVCHGLLIITVITPLPTKPSATKMPEN